jgi:hypothetical protein
MKKSIKNLEVKSIKATTVKGGSNGSGTRFTSSTSTQTQQTELL